MREEDSYEDKILSCLSQLREDTSRLPNATTRNVGNNSVKLPTVPLPTFSNSRDDNLKKFFRSFESIIDKHCLNDYEKFVYLRGQLSGGPKTLIDSLDVDNQSYHKAKDLLEKAFDCKLTAKFDIMFKITNLKMTFNTDPYSFIGEMRSIISEFEYLNFTTDDVLQFFIWNAFNDNFQNHMIAVTNKNKPSLKEITENIFEVTERYERQRKKTNDKRHQSSNKTDPKSEEKISTNNMAVNVMSEKSNKKFCLLCNRDKKNHEHFMGLCRNYDTPRKKFNKLKDLRACTKCGLGSHESKSCKFKFSSPCQQCSGQHMTFLCLKGEKSGSTNVKSSSSEEINNHVFTVKMASSMGQDSIFLHTLTSTVIGKHKSEKIRTFKDGGCQRTFIKENLANKLNLKVLRKDIDLTIRGFLTSKTIRTKSVEVELLIGSVKKCIEAICIDKIEVNFKIPDLQTIAKKFRNKGYHLADEGFIYSRSGMVNDVQLILGNDNDHVLPMKYVEFGYTNPPAGFMETHAGIILSGSSQMMRRNLEHLPMKHGKGITESEEHSNCYSIDTKYLDESDEYDTRVIDSLSENESKYEHEDIEKLCEETLDIAEYANETITDSNKKLTDYVLNSTEIDEEGYLVMPLTWNQKNSHLLSNNYE